MSDTLLLGNARQSTMNERVGATCLLFAYGLLQPGYRPPRSMTRHWRDTVNGALYDLGPYPAAVDIDCSERTIEGTVVEIAEDELAALDHYEDVDRGLYGRKKTTTRSGAEVWIYEYRLEVPSEAPLVPRWPHAAPGVSAIVSNPPS